MRYIVSREFELCIEERGTHECDEECEGQDDGQRPASFEHGASLVDVRRPRAVALTAIVSERAQVDVQAASGEVGAVCICDATQGNDSSDQSAHKAEIDECDEESIMARS